MLGVHMAVGLGQVAVQEDPAADVALKLAARADEQACKDLVLFYFLGCIWI